MKKYIKLTLLFLFLSTFGNLFASQWGILDDFVEASEADRKTNYAMDKFLSNQPISYYISYPRNRIKDDIKYAQATAESITLWPAFVADYIVKKGREQEFADIMPLLTRQVRLRRVSSAEQSDIHFSYRSLEEVKNYCGEEFIGCFKDLDQIIYIPLLNKNDSNKSYVMKILIHEVGHFYGLGDQYRFAVVNSSITHSTIDRIDSTDSIMAIGDSLGCDDIDGFINLMDLTLFKRQGDYSARAKQGWKSFCDNTMYKNAEVLNKKDYVIGKHTYQFDLFLLDGKEVSYHHGRPSSTQGDDPNSRINFRLEKRKTSGSKIKYVATLYINNNFHTQVEAERVLQAKGLVYWYIPYDNDLLSLGLRENQCWATIDRRYRFWFNNEPALTEQMFFYSQSASSKKTKIDTLLTRLPITIGIEGKKVAQNHWRTQCAFTLEGKANALVTENEKVISSKDEVLQAIAMDHNVSVQDIIDSAIELCDAAYRSGPIEKISDFRQLCSHFRLVEKSL